MPVKRVQSLEFYGANTYPRPARRGVERGGDCVYPWERGSGDGGMIEPTAPCFPFEFSLAPGTNFMSTVVQWSEAGAAIRKVRVSNLSP